MGAAFSVFVSASLQCETTRLSEEDFSVLIQSSSRPIVAMGAINDRSKRDYFVSDTVRVAICLGSLA